MNEEPAFLAAIQSSPQDEAIRLVYADWLEERGDPRSELVRMETALARLAVYSDDYVEQKVRRDALRSRFDANWLQKMGYVPTHRPMFQKLPVTPIERWRLAAEFIDLWHRPLNANDGSSEEELVAAENRIGRRLPKTLRDWYKVTGNRRESWSQQDSMIAPPELRLDVANHRLVIRAENQSCELWGIRESDLDLDDPPIFEFLEPGQVSATTSAFLLQVLVYESMFANKMTAGGEVPGEIIAETVDQRFAKCDLPDRYWVASPIHFYEGTDIVLQTHAGSWVYAVARTEKAFAQLSESLWPYLERYR